MKGQIIIVGIVLAALLVVVVGVAYFITLQKPTNSSSSTTTILAGSTTLGTTTSLISSSSTTILLGTKTNTIGGTNTTGGQGGGAIVAFPIIASQSGILNTLGINMRNCGFSNYMQLGIYQDNNGNPGSLMGYTSSTACVPGWTDIPISYGNPLISGTKYWLAIEQQGSNSAYYANTGTNNYVSTYPSVGSAFGYFPNPYTSGGTNTGLTANMRITYK